MSSKISSSFLTQISSARVCFQIRSHSEVPGGHELGGRLRDCEHVLDLQIRSYNKIHNVQVTKIKVFGSVPLMH